MKLPPAKFLIPLSYATILGGICTLIGTSTNLVVDGMIQDAGFKGFSIFELGQVRGDYSHCGYHLFGLFCQTFIARPNPER